MRDEKGEELGWKLLEEACELFEAGERSRSIELFHQAADLGSLEAQVNLGNIYDDGDGVTADFEKARKLYLRAIGRGSPEGAYNLGISYRNRGNWRWARYWLGVAKSRGDECADEELHALNESPGAGVPSIKRK
ncbi:sel1 repeat family protein [Luteibacter aegosomaticola]|uniref:tetratricopeptide repeat protein n=1 Tax=Luteibacter aegosomaticola TaxID=2911538 RepID=UPI001FF9D86A|nr:tetratricopeptide repeat protein [Luteibacter aegosomaticola]UPG89985.1 sel1 repeat family protein [Luteibacter aegosomaticola]